MKRFRISVGTSRLRPAVERKSVRWATLAKRLLQFDVIDHKYDEYLKLDRERQSSLKDVGYFIGGQFNGNLRHLDKMQMRSVITLDVDHLDSWDLEEIVLAYSKYEYVVHSTLKHSPETPRLRLVFPLAKEIPVDQYEPLARKLADQIGLDVFDDTSFQPGRIFFWPAVCSDGAVFKHHNAGKFISADRWLAKYNDWQDFAEWPHSTRVTAIRPAGRQAEDPLTKKGIIGAFCRTFDIHAAIERFELPYEQTEHDNRYRPLDATGPSGAVVYDDIFLYSHHESDVVSRQNVNAWDLVRIHKYGEKDAGVEAEMPIMQRPSSKLMAALAGAIPEVQQELRVSPSELENVKEANADGGMESGESTPVSTDLTFDSLLNEISDINPHVKNLLTVAKSMIPRIAAAKLDPQDNDYLAGVLRDAYPKPKPSKIAVLQGIKQAGKRLTGALADGAGGIVDMERLLIDAALTEHFDSGKTLKRIGKRCWTYEEGLWEMDEDEKVRGYVAETITRLRVERPDDMLALVATVGEGKTGALVKSLWGLLCDSLAIKTDRDDPVGLMRSFPLPIINCRNCELHFDVNGNIKVRDHDPEHFYTIRVDTSYNPKATCPEWDRFMQMIFSNTSDAEDMTRHLEEFGGYVIQMSRWLKSWSMFHGTKDTGKSTVAMVLQTMLGKAYTGKSMEKFSKSSSDFNEEGIIGKLLMIDDDYRHGAELPDGFLKKYSEEKPTTTSIKYGSDVNFKARAMPLILSNHWPVTHDTTAAFIERALVIPFTYRIKGAQQDDQRRVKMMNEMPGILNRFIAGIQRLRERGSWDKPIDCVEVEQKWARSSNPFMQFVSDCLAVGGGYESRIERGKAFELYERWSANQLGNSRQRSHSMTRRKFYDRMREQFSEIKSNERWFTGVCKKDDILFLTEELGDFGDE